MNKDKIEISECHVRQWLGDEGLDMAVEVLTKIANGTWPVENLREDVILTCDLPDEDIEGQSEKMKSEDLAEGYEIYGNKGAVWSDKCHIDDGNSETMCGIPMLSNNWARSWGHEIVGCPDCLKLYREEIQSFVPHGIITISNSISFEIELSECGDGARVRDGNKVSVWKEIRYKKSKAYINYRQFDIYMEDVMKIN